MRHVLVKMRHVFRALYKKLSGQNETCATIEEKANAIEQRCQDKMCTCATFAKRIKSLKLLSVY